MKKNRMAGIVVLFRLIRAQLSHLYHKSGNASHIAMNMIDLVFMPKNDFRGFSTDRVKTGVTGGKV